MYFFDYFYIVDQWIDLSIIDNLVENFDVVFFVIYNFINVFFYDYGLLDNVIVGMCILLVVKYDFQDELIVYDFGDIFLIGCWQLFVYVSGKVLMILFSIFILKIGVSFYEIDIDEQLLMGSGYYFLVVGFSLLKVLDLVVVFGFISVIYNFQVDGFDQVWGVWRLVKVDFGFGLFGLVGFVYFLFYDILFSIFVQFSYNDEIVLIFSNGDEVVVQDQMIGFLSMLFGI